MDKRKAGIAFVAWGSVLFSAALLLFLYQAHSDAAREKETRTLYHELQAVVAQRQDTASAPIPSVPADTDTVQETEAAAAESRGEPPSVTVQGHECIGILEIPALSLSLPVLSEWSYEKLELAPCRHLGSAAGGDLVIAGHNYKAHFKYLDRLVKENEIRLTDAAGKLYTYAVAEIRTVRAEDVDGVLHSGYDLVLYTCTYTGTARTAVFCRRIAE